MTSLQPRLCYITDRRSLDSASQLLPLIRAAAEAGVELVQIREKDMRTRELLSLVGSALDVTGGTATRVIVNDRLDVALASGAGGVHLGHDSMPATEVRAALHSAKNSFWVGVSCHSVADVRAAEDVGASYALLGPIFETTSKLKYGPPLGLAVLAEASRNCRVPLVALGGITLERVRACIGAGASGIAGISLFQKNTLSVPRLSLLREQVIEAASAGTRS